MKKERLLELAGIVEEQDVPRGTHAEEEVTKFHSSADHREVSDEFFTALANQVEPHGLRVYVVDDGSDTYFWRIGK